MRKEFVGALAALALMPTPALAGAGGPGVGTVWGGVIIIAAAVIGYIIGAAKK
jgi:hypothetical protein